MATALERRIERVEQKTGGAARGVMLISWQTPEDEITSASTGEGRIYREQGESFADFLDAVTNYCKENKANIVWLEGGSI